MCMDTNQNDCLHLPIQALLKCSINTIVYKYKYIHCQSRRPYNAVKST